MTLVLPGARLGHVQYFGTFRLPGGRPGVDLLCIDHLVQLQIYRDIPDAKGRMRAVKYHALEFGWDRANQLADYVHEAEVKSGRSLTQIPTGAIMDSRFRKVIEARAGATGVVVMVWRHVDGLFGASMTEEIPLEMGQKVGGKMALLLRQAAARAKTVGDSPMPNRAPPVVISG